MSDFKRITIRFPLDIWRRLRRAQESGLIESIQQAAIDAVTMFLDQLEVQTDEIGKKNES